MTTGTIEALVTNYYLHKKKGYSKNHEMVVKNEEKLGILREADYVFMDYDDTLADAPALQTILSLLDNKEVLKWLPETAWRFLQQGKAAQSEQWEKIARKLFIKDEDVKWKPTYTELADKIAWSRGKTEKMIYSGAPEFFEGLRDYNPDLKYFHITRDIEPIVGSAYGVLGIPQENLEAYYLVDDKSKVINSLDLEKGKAVYLWDSGEDIFAMKKLKEKLGEENVLSIQVVESENDITRYADVAIFKNYNPLLRFLKA